MDAVATASPNPRSGVRVPLLATHVQHSYGTRIRKNSIIKPSTRLRHSPDPSAPRRIKPIPMPKLVILSSDHQTPPSPDMPIFPPPHVTLHSEDTSSKVFLAIGRSFMSVDNRAMTIKDLAEMTLKFGLICQNVSAAGQAITTYIRNHMQRCEAQDDLPLLLRHTLSGTSSDDELLPALHSRTGGAHCTANSEDRSTNFRRGTMVWYLSRATGAPCPFTRVGIRLCEYGENGKIGMPSGSREKKRARDRQRRSEQCGQKRKRQLRGYKGSDGESAEEGKKPPKVKLLLRLRPSASASATSSAGSESQTSGSTNDTADLFKESDSEASSEDSMSVDSGSEDEENTETPFALPPYPKRSLSIPCYTPSIQHLSTLTKSSPYLSMASYVQPFRRSPSITFSTASPPPDSEFEDDDFHISMTGLSQHFSLDEGTAHAPPDSDMDTDSEEDQEDLWDSPGPRSPSVSLGDARNILIKQEPGEVEGVQGMLDLWEPLDSNVDGNKVMAVVAKAAARFLGETPQVKVEETDAWAWEEEMYNSSWYEQSIQEINTIPIKLEDLDYDSALISSDESVASPSSYVSGSPLTPLPESVSSPVTSASAPNFTGPSCDSKLAWKNIELLGPDSVHPLDFDDGEWPESVGAGAVRPRSKTQSFLPVFEASRDLPSYKPFGLDDQGRSLLSTLAPLRTSSSSGVVKQPSMSRDTIVVRTCQPCVPAITVTHFEDIPVYQVQLGTSTVFRRVDTGFVHLSPIVEFLGIPFLPPSPDAVLLSQGSAIISGTWVPLASAQAFIRHNPVTNNILDTFLSDSLSEQFPAALRDFHYSNSSGRASNQFGPGFKSTLEVTRRPELINAIDLETWHRGSTTEWDVEDDLLASHPSFSLDLPSLRMPVTEEAVPETPLSPTEQEIFQSLCCAPDWDSCPPTPTMTRISKAFEDAEDDSVSLRTRDHPRRRSKRVANASCVAKRTRSQKRHSHNSS